MTAIKSKIDVLQSILENEIDENLLLSKGESLLVELRQTWSKHKNDFTDNDITKLRSFTISLEAVSEFIDLQEEFEYVQSIEDANTIIDELFLLSEQLHEFRVKGRL